MSAYSAPVCIPPKPLYRWCDFLHLALTHLENKDSNVRILFIDFSLSFNTIIPQQIINKLNLLGLNNSLCNLILDFLTRRPQSVRVGRNTSSTTTMSTGAPQGCVHSPLLFTLLAHDCTNKFSSNHIIKFADDTSVVGLISNNDETHYREEVVQLAEWCGENNQSLNVSKTKEVVMDFRQNSGDHPPLTINSSTVERVSSTKFLGVHITEDLTWTTNTTSLSKKAQQRLHFLRRLKRAILPPPILTTFYRGTIESVLTSCITVWYGNCSAANRKTLQRTVNTAAKIIGASLPSILDIFLARCSSKANSIVKDPTHHSHSLFHLLPSGRRYRNIRARSARLLNSFSPQSVRALNSNHPAPHWNTIQTPTSWNMDHPSPLPPPPALPHHWKKHMQLCCAIRSVLHSPLFALDTFNTLLFVHNPTKDSIVHVCLHAHALQITFHCSPVSCLTYDVSLCTCIHLKHLYSLYSLYFFVYV